MQREIEQQERAQDLQDPGGNFHKGFDEYGNPINLSDNDYRDNASSSTRRGGELHTYEPLPGEIEWGDHPDNERERKLARKCPDSADCLDENFCYADYDCFECDYCFNFQCMPKEDHKDCNADRDCPCSPNEGQEWHCLDGGPKGDEEISKCYLTCNEDFGCMPGYVCDPETFYCEPGCQSDEECKCGTDTSAPDCIDGGVCIDGVCEVGCNDSEDCRCTSPNPAKDCRAAAVCEDGHCVSPCDVPVWCENDGDCETGRIGDPNRVCVPYYGPRGISYPQELELYHCIDGCRKDSDCEPICWYTETWKEGCSCSEEELEYDPDCYKCIEEDEDCHPQVCMGDAGGNVCDRPCNSDSMCATEHGEACVDRFCQEVGFTCLSNSDCSGDEFCNADGRCARGCRTWEDCAEEECPRDKECMDQCPIDPTCTCEELPINVDCEGVEWRQYCEKDPNCLNNCPLDSECEAGKKPPGQSCYTTTGECMHLCSTDAYCRELYGRDDVDCIDPDADNDKDEVLDPDSDANSNPSIETDPPGGGDGAGPEGGGSVPITGRWGKSSVPLPWPPVTGDDGAGSGSNSDKPRVKRCVIRDDRDGDDPGGGGGGCPCGEACGMNGICEPEGCMDGVLCSQGVQACQNGRCVDRDGCSCEDGCDDDTGDDALACCTNNDCEDGLKCVPDETSDQPGCGFCQDICTSDEDCKDGKKCMEDGTCGYACEPIIPCTETVDCPEGQWCAPSKVCEFGCGTDEDCIFEGDDTWMVCRNFECVQACATQDDCCGVPGDDGSGNPNGECQTDEECDEGCICEDFYCNCGCVGEDSPNACEPGYVCQPDGFTCKHPCEEDVNCPPELVCYDGWCDEFRCETYEDCRRAGFGEQYECVIDTDGVGHCLDLCYGDDDCGCEGEPGAIATDECSSVCVAGECVGLPECLDNGGCSGGDICEDGSCVEPPEPGEEGCTSDAECEGDFVCQYGVCEAPCNVFCVEGVCEQAAERKCYSDSECAGKEICSNGSCSEGCRSDGSCSGAKVCVSNKCKLPCWNNAECKGAGFDVCQPDGGDSNKKKLATCQKEVQILKDNGAPDAAIIAKQSECEAYAKGEGGYCENINDEGDGEEGGSTGCKCWEKCDKTGNCAKVPCKNQSDCECCACLSNGFCGEPSSDADCPGSRIKVDDDCTCEQPCMPELKCSSNEECPAFAFCEGRSGMCVSGCRDSGGCLDGQTCLNGACIKGCETTDDCDYRMERCNNGACVYTGYVCETSEDCPAGQPLCENGYCIEDYRCNISDECPGDELCIEGRCSPPPECTSSAGCPEVDVETCVVGDACDDDTPCPGGGECRNGVCFFCTPGKADTQCLQGQCTDKTLCNGDEDCFGGQICTNGSCDNGTRCLSFTDCDEREICKGGVCVEDTTCFQDSDCAGGQYCLGGNCADAGDGSWSPEYGEACEDCGHSCDPTSFTCRPHRCGATPDDCELPGGECKNGICKCDDGADCTDTGTCDPTEDGQPLFCCLDLDGEVREEDDGSVTPIKRCYDCCVDADCEKGICDQETRTCIECRIDSDCAALYPSPDGQNRMVCVENVCQTPCGTGLSTGDCFEGLTYGDTCDNCPGECPDDAPCGESYRLCGEYQMVNELGEIVTRFVPCNVCLKTCEEHIECPVGMICRKERLDDETGECGVDTGVCATDADCARLNRPENNLLYTCQDAICTEVDGPICFNNSDCGEGAICDTTLGYCMLGNCGPENECSPGMVCKERRCRWACDTAPIQCGGEDGTACPPGFAANTNVYDEEGNQTCRCARHGYNGADPGGMGCPSGEMCLEGGCMPVVPGVRECGSDNDCKHLNKILYGQEAEVYVGGCGEGCRVDQVEQLWFCDISNEEETGVLISMCQPAEYTYKYETAEESDSSSGTPPPRPQPEPPGEEVDPCEITNQCCGDDGFCGACGCDEDHPCSATDECCDEGSGVCVKIALHPETELGVPDGCALNNVFCKVEDGEGNHVSPLGYPPNLYTGCTSEIVCEEDEDGKEVCTEEKECFQGGPLSDDQIKELMTQDCRPPKEDQDCDCDWGDRGPPPDESECQFDSDCGSCLVCKAEYWKGDACCPLSSTLITPDGEEVQLDGVYRNICKSYYAEDSKEAEEECSCETDDDCTECEVCDRTNRDQGFDGVIGDETFGKCRASCDLCPCGGKTSYTNTSCSGCKKWGKCAIEGTDADGNCACVIDRNNPCCEAFDSMCDLTMSYPGCKELFPDGKEPLDSGCIEKTVNINGSLYYEQVAYCIGGRNGDTCAQCTTDAHCPGKARCMGYECVKDCGDENVVGDDTRYCMCCDKDGGCRQLYETWQESTEAPGSGGEGSTTSMCRPCQCTEEGVDCQSYQSCEACWQWVRTDGTFTDGQAEYQAGAEAAFKADRFQTEQQLFNLNAQYEKLERSIDPLKEATQEAEAAMIAAVNLYEEKCKECDCFLCGNNKICAPNCEELAQDATAARTKFEQVNGQLESAKTNLDLTRYQIAAIEDALLTKSYRPGEWKQVKVCSCCIDGMCRSEDECAYGTCYLCPVVDENDKSQYYRIQLYAKPGLAIGRALGSWPYDGVTSMEASYYLPTKCGNWNRNECEENPDVNGGGGNCNVYMNKSSRDDCVRYKCRDGISWYQELGKTTYTRYYEYCTGSIIACAFEGLKPGYVDKTYMNGYDFEFKLEGAGTRAGNWLLPEEDWILVGGGPSNPTATGSCRWPNGLGHIRGNELPTFEDVVYTHPCCFASEGVWECDPEHPDCSTKLEILYEPGDVFPLIKKLRREKEQLEWYISILLGQYEELKKFKEAQEQSVEEMDKEVAKLCGEMNQHKADLQYWEGERDRLEGLINGGESDQDDKEQDCEDAKAEVERIQEDLVPAIDQRDADQSYLTALGQQKETVGVNIGNIKGEIASKNAEAAGYQERLDEINNDLLPGLDPESIEYAELMAEAEQLATDIQDITGCDQEGNPCEGGLIADLEAEQKSLNDELIDLETNQIPDAESALETSQGDVDNLNNELTVALADRSEKCGDAGDGQNDLTTLKGQLTAANKEIERLTELIEQYVVVIGDDCDGGDAKERIDFVWGQKEAAEDIMEIICKTDPLESGKCGSDGEMKLVEDRLDEIDDELERLSEELGEVVEPEASARPAAGDAYTKEEILEMRKEEVEEAKEKANESWYP